MIDGAHRHTQSPVIWCEWAQERLELEYVIVRWVFAVDSCLPATDREFQIAGRITGRQGPEFPAVRIDPGPNLQLATMGIGQSCIVRHKGTGGPDVNGVQALTGRRPRSFSYRSVYSESLSAPVAPGKARTGLHGARAPGVARGFCRRNRCSIRGRSQVGSVSASLQSPVPPLGRYDIAPDRVRQQSVPIE